MNTRVLFLDDSGKPDANHQSTAVVIAGFSVPSDRVTTLSRQVLGAKGRFFTKRGQPTTWEIKAADIIKPNPWKRTTNRDFAFELVRIIAGLDATVYSVAIDKKKMKHAMTLTQTMPLQLQALVEHFEVECRHLGETGLLVADWSSHQADQHASTCVASFVASKRLPIHPSVYYASSHSTQAIQVADLFAGVRRRVLEGDSSLIELAQEMDRIRTVPAALGLKTIKNRSFNPKASLF